MMKIDYGILAVVCSAIVSISITVFTGWFDAVYILVVVCLDVFYRGIYTPLKEQRKMISDGNRFLVEHKKEG